LQVITRHLQSIVAELWSTNRALRAISGAKPSIKRPAQSWFNPKQ
jgi:hypothetical protein